MTMREEVREGCRLTDTEFQFNKRKSSEALLQYHGDILNITVNCTGENSKDVMKKAVCYVFFTIKSIIAIDTYKKRQEGEIQKSPKSPSNQHRSARVSFLSQKGAGFGRDHPPGHCPRWTLQCPLWPPGGLRGQRDPSSPARKVESGNL